MDGLKKNDVIPLKIIDITTDGNGVGRAENGLTVFVPFTVIGDSILCHIVKIHKSYAYGIINKILLPSPDRLNTIDCPVFTKCGGCSFRNMSYTAELRIKTKFVKDAFNKFENIHFEEIHGAATIDSIDRYRNKAQFPVCDINQDIVYGFYGKRSHRVIPINDCLLQPRIFSDIADFCVNFAKDNKIPAYNEQTGTGVLRHIYIRKGHFSDQIMVCLVVKNLSLKDKFVELSKQLTAKFENIKSVVLNINPNNTNVILGDKNITIAGQDYITDTLCGLKINLSPMAFYQVNTAQTQNLYQYAKDKAELNGLETVLDLYCGAGTIGLFFADIAKKVIGGEIVSEAIKNARENAIINSIDNIEFIEGDAGQIAADLIESNLTPNIVIVDPPRKGCDKLTLDSVIKLSPSKIIMISCHAATAARDCSYLSDFGYKITSVKPFDLFPRTTHVECVAVLDKI